MSYINQDEPILDALDKITQNTAGYTRYTRNPIFERLCFYDGYYATFDADGIEIWDADYDEEWDVVHKMFKITKTLATITKGQGIQLEINKQPVKMTHFLTQKCEQLLYEHKLQSQHIKEKSVPDYNEAIKLEQKRGIYKKYKRPYEMLNVINVQKPEIVIIDEQDWIYKYPYCKTATICMNGVTEKQQKVTRKLFLSKKERKRREVLDGNISKTSYGTYRLVVTNLYTGREVQLFEFYNEYNAYMFEYLLVGGCNIHLSENHIPRIFIKGKIR